MTSTTFYTGRVFVLASLIQRVTFDLVLGQVIAPEPLITLQPKGGIRVVVRRRQVGNER